MNRTAMDSEATNQQLKLSDVAQGCVQITHIPLNRALFEGTDIFSGLRNLSGHYQVYLFNPTMHSNNECTIDVYTTAREYP